MAESKKGHNFAIQGPKEKKNTCSHIFVLMLYIKFQVPSSSSSLVLQPTKGVTDRQTDGRTDGQTDRPKPQCPIVGGIIKKYFPHADCVAHNIPDMQSKVQKRFKYR